LYEVHGNIRRVLRECWERVRTQVRGRIFGYADEEVEKIT